MKKFLSQHQQSVTFPSVLLTNIRSLRSNFSELCVSAATFKPSVIALTETWLDESIPDDCISLAGFLLFREDRANRRGGGVCAYVDEGERVSRISDVDPPPECCECLWLHFRSQELIMLLIYIPPNLLSVQHKLITNYVIRNLDTTQATVGAQYFMICGDLNDFPSTDLESTLGMTQMVKDATRGNSLLDKILFDSSQDAIYETPIVGSSIGSSDHQAVLMRPKEQKMSQSTKLVKLYDYREENILRFLKNIANVNWSLMYRLPPNEIDTKCSFFYEVFEDAKACIPYDIVEMRVSDKPWVTPLLKHLINKRFEAFRCRNFALYKHLKSKIKIEIDKAKQLWSKKIMQRNQGIWSISTAQYNKKALHSKLSNLLLEFSSLSEAVNAINDVFSKVFTIPNVQQSKSRPVCNVGSSLLNWNPEVRPHIICEMLNRIDCRKACGSDNIPAILLKASRFLIAEPLSHLFAVSIENGKLPRVWKCAKVIPVPKKKVTSINDLRPISLLPIVSKIFEKIVLMSVKPQLLQVYGPEQYGFRPQSSTLMSHLATHDFVTRAMERPEVKGVVFVSFDMSKAFDRIPHDKAIRILEEKNFPCAFIDWCRDYFLDRSQYVQLQGVMSYPRGVTSGIPQGSILGPYIFNAYVSSLSTVRETNCIIKYADDTLILIPYSSLIEAETFLKEEIENVEQWCENHGLILNREKTQLMSARKKYSDPFPTNILGLHVESQLTHLGVIFDEKLNWRTHVLKSAKKAAQRIYPLKQLKKLKVIGRYELIQIYNAYVRSVLEYNSPLFVGMNKGNTKILERVQKRCHRIICSNDCTSGCLEPLTQRRTNQAIKVFQSTLNQSHILHHLSPQVLQRTSALSIPFCLTQRRALSFFPFCARMFNSM